MDLVRERALMTTRKGSDVGMKEWVTLVDGSKTVENLSTIEFELANAELHDEFRLYVEIDKNANADEKQHNLNININGMAVGYYLFNSKWDYLLYGYIEIEKNPTPKILYAPFSSLNLKYNVTSRKLLLNNIGTETGDRKLVFKFPTDYKYTGTIKVQLYAR